MSGQGFSDVRAVLRIRDYRNFLLSRVFATLSTQMQALIVSWQIYQMTKDPLALGMIGLVEAVVFIGFATWAGHYADRHEKRNIIFVTQGLTLALCGRFYRAFHGGPGHPLFGLYAVVALTGFARSYMWPASFAYSELTVPREIYGRAASLNSTGWEVASIVGPAMGGLIYAWYGPTAAYGTVFVLMAIAVYFTCFMGPIPASKGADEKRDFLSGFHFVFSNPVILAAISLDMFAVLFGGVYAILPISADRLGVGAKGLGWLRAAPSVGAILMSVYQVYRPPFAASRSNIIDCRRPFWPGHHRLYFIEQLPVFHDRSGLQRDGRQCERRHPGQYSSGFYPGFHARSGILRERHFHWVLERNRGF